MANATGRGVDGLRYLFPLLRQESVHGLGNVVEERHPGVARQLRAAAGPLASLWSREEELGGAAGRELRASHSQCVTARYHNPLSASGATDCGATGPVSLAIGHTITAIVQVILYNA